MPWEAGSTEIDCLILSHRLSVENFRQALRRGNAAAEDAAFEEELLAMLALVSRPPKTLPEASRRASYLAQTRFMDDLTAEGRAYLFSLVR